MPNFFLPVSDLERSMKAIYGIGRQHPVAAQVQLRYDTIYYLH